MAGQYVTFGECRQSALYRSDLEGYTDRHPTLNVNQEINLSIRALRIKLANNDVWPVLTSTAILNLPTTEAVVGGGYSEIPWPVDAVSVHGIDARVGGTWSTIPQGDFAQRRLGPYNSQRGDYQYADTGLAMWIVRSLPSNSTSGTGAIMLFPVPQGGQYVLWYLQQFSDITSDTTEIPFGESWSQWVIEDVVCKLLLRDTGPQVSQALQLHQGERDRYWSEIHTKTQRLASDSAIQPQSRYSTYRGGPRMIP